MGVKVRWVAHLCDAVLIQQYGPESLRQGWQVTRRTQNELSRGIGPLLASIRHGNALAASKVLSTALHFAIVDGLVAGGEARGHMWRVGNALLHVLWPQCQV